MPLDVVHSVAAFTEDNIVEENVLGDAEISAVGEEVVPGGPDNSVIELSEVDPGQKLSEESRHKDVVQSRCLHESRVIFH